MKRNPSPGALPSSPAPVQPPAEPGAGARPGTSAEDRPAVALELDRFMPYRLSMLSSRISATLARRYETRFGVTIPQWRVMAVLGQHRLLSAGEVAARTRMDKAKVSRTIAVMERKGLLHRTIEPRDLRMVRLELTPEGQGVYREIAAMALDWERDLLAGLRPAALAGLESAICDLQARLDRLAPDEAPGNEAVEP